MKQCRALFLVGVMCVLLAVMVTGCRHTANMKNPAVATSVTLTDASNTCKLLEDNLTAATHAISLVETTDPKYYVSAEKVVKKLSAANRFAADKINDAMNGNPADWQTAFYAIGSTVKPEDLTAVQVKNPNTQLLITASMQALVKILTSFKH